MRQLPLVFLSFAACSSDNTVTSLCSHDQEGFDIEEASELEDAQGYPGMHDAVILEFDTSGLPEGAAWRVKRVEILPMIGDSAFAGFDDGQEVRVEVFDADDPDGERYSVGQDFDKDLDGLDWMDTTLDAPTEATEADQQAAWWGFDFTEAIPLTGLQSDEEYLVGVVWDDSGLPALGYSNFNRDCDRNWTDYADGAGWVLNEGEECSWPMLRVELEVIEEKAQCNEDNTVIDP